jgi:5-keto-L-gluconate epimerase
MKLSVTIIDEASSKVPVILRGKYEETIRKAAEIGYKGIELHLDDPNQINQDEFIQLCQNHHLSLTSIGTGPGYGRRGLSLSAPDVKIRERAINCIKDHIRFASEFDSVVIIGLMKGLVSECGNEESFFANLETSLRECLVFAEEMDVVLVLEAINRYESDSLNTIEQCTEFVKKIDSSHLKVHIDSYHMNIEEDNIYENIKKAGNYIGHVHIADSNRWYPGNGHFDFSKLVEELRNIDYKGALAVECLSLPSQHEAAEKAFTYLTGLKVITQS